MSGARRMRHPLAERGADLYETPDVAVHALRRAEMLPLRIWEPACGPGAIVRVLRAAGHEVVATDINNYGCPDSKSGVDFLMEVLPPHGIGAIVTNPPFKLANEFVRHALTLCPRVVMLLPLTFCETNCRRNDLLDGGTLARVHVFRNRLPMMHRFGWQGPKSTSTKAYAWIAWDSAHQGPTALHRLSWSAS